MSESTSDSRTVFDIPDFRYYCLSRFSWQLGLQMTTVATAWLVYERTMDPLALGFIGLATLAPNFLLALVTGPMADRHDRRLILLISCAVMALGALATVALTWRSEVWPIYVVVVIMGAARAFSQPAAQALAMDIIPDRLSSSGLAWNASVVQTGTIVGPALGGLLYPFGAQVPFIAAFILFALSIAMAWLIRARTKPAHRPPVTLDMLIGGYKYIWRTPIILGTISLDLIVVLVAGAVALLPIFADEIYKAGPWALGVLRAAPAVGSLIASVAIAYFPLRRGVGKTMFLCTFVFAVATIGFALTTNMIVACFFLAVRGAADVISVVIRQTFIQIETPSEMRGRVIAVHGITANTSNQLGDFEAGVLAHFIGAVNAVLVGGVAAAGATLLWMKLFPVIWTRDRFESATPGRAEPRKASASA